MKVHADQLAHKRRELQLRCDLQRHQIAQLGGDIEARLAGVDRVIRFARNIADRPILVVAAAAGALLLGPWRILRWASRGAVVYSAVRNVQRLLGNSRS